MQPPRPLPGMSRAPTATITTQQLAHRRVFVVRVLPVRVAAALKAPKRPKNPEIWEARVGAILG